MRTLLPGLLALVQALSPVPPDLRGTWELVEHGVRRDSAIPLVQITQAGDHVTAEFLTGAHCDDGHDRNYAFDGRLVFQPTLTPFWTLESQDMRVCSGSPSAVKECNGGIPGHYVTTFANATVQPNRISGSRTTQGYRGCTPDSKENGTARFELRRLQPCELEQRKYDQETNDARFLRSRITSLSAIFDRAIEAARNRYGDTFNGQPTALLQYPPQLFAGDLSTNGVELQLFFEVMPDYIGHPDWAAARAMAGAMGSGANPLPEAAAMVQEMRRVEGFLADARQQVTRLANASAALEACRKKNQP